MAKAATEDSTWTLLSEAKILAVEVYQSPSFAEQLIRRWLEAGRIRWRCLTMEGRHHDLDRGPGSRQFWQEVDHPGQRGPQQVALYINWAESSARRHRRTAYRIELVREDLEKLLGTYGADQEATASAKWCAAYARRLKDEGKLNRSTSKIELATLISKGTVKARKSGVRTLQPRSIANELENWGLWPIDKI